jgi:hypothetical protein
VKIIGSKIYVMEPTILERVRGIDKFNNGLISDFDSVKFLLIVKNIFFLLIEEKRIMYPI